MHGAKGTIILLHSEMLFDSFKRFKTLFLIPNLNKPCALSVQTAAHKILSSLETEHVNDR